MPANGRVTIEGERDCQPGPVKGISLDGVRYGRLYPENISFSFGRLYPWVGEEGWTHPAIDNFRRLTHSCCSSFRLSVLFPIARLISSWGGV